MTTVSALARLGLQRILTARFAIVSSAHAKLFSIDMLPVSAIGLRMVAAANLVEVAALVGDTARATMLNALMGGKSLTATELAYCANVSRSTASGHLGKLVAARLLTVIRER